MKYKPKITLLIFLALFLLIEPAFSQFNFQFQGNRKKTQISFKKAGGLMVLQTYINDKGPFNFILDSGVGLVVITDPKLKDSLKLEALRKISVSGLGELDSINAFLAPFLNLKIGRVQAKSIAAVILEKDILNLSSLAGIEIHGLIGFDFFNSFIVKTNYEAGYITLYTNDLLPPLQILKKTYKIPITIEQNKPYCKLNLTIDGKEYLLKLIIDTGADHALALESFENEAFPLTKKYIPANLGIGLAGKIKGYLGRVEELNMEGLKINNVISSFPRYEDVAAKVISVPRNGSIGNRLLKFYNITYDYQKGFIYLRKISNTKPVFEHNMSGLQILSHGKNYNEYYINDVEKESPGDEIGLQKDDELLSLNFKRTSTMTLNEIDELLRAKEGRKIIIEVSRGDEFILGVLTLRKRI